MYFLIALVRECVVFGTTVAMIAPSIARTSIPCLAIRSVITIPYSSDVLVAAVMIWKVLFNSVPSKTPNVIVVLPTSTASNIDLSPLIFVQKIPDILF